jgi:hypothetical protein
MKPIKNLPVYVLSAALIFVGVASASQAQAAWSAKETSRVKTLEAKVQQLERQLSTQELVTVRYLATGGSGGTYGDICPGDENLDFGGGNASYIGRLSPKTDIFGRPVTDIRGEAISAYVYACKIQFYAKKNY